MSITERHPKFLRWLQRLEEQGVTLEQLDFLSEVSRDGVQLFSGFIDTRMRTPEGQIQPRCMLIKGDSVMIVPWLVCEGVDYTLLVGQRRPVHGKITWEFPGGMIDAADNEPGPAAFEEASEELGLDLQPGEIVALSDEPLAVCTASMDELVYPFYFRRELSRTELKALDGGSTGLASEGEYLTLKVSLLADVGQSPIASNLAGLKLLEMATGRRF